MFIRMGRYNRQTARRTVLCPSRFMKPSARRETAVKTTQGIMNVPPTVWTEAPAAYITYMCCWYVSR